MTPRTFILNDLHVTAFMKSPDMPFVLFVHGGPGLNTYCLDTLIRDHGLFGGLNANLVIYDQRNCGRSGRKPKVAHHDNVSDLAELIDALQKDHLITIKGVIGHSYGAKIAHDFYKIYGQDLKYVFVSTSRNLLTPRLNNLLLDLKYLQREEPILYDHFLEHFSVENPNAVWQASVELASYFSKNPERPSFYWANRLKHQQVKAIEAQSPYPICQETFRSVREDLYLINKNYDLDFTSFNISFRWIVGFFDYIMGGSDPSLVAQGATVFSRSAHYPHLEENHRFCEEINEFMLS